MSIRVPSPSVLRNRGIPAEFHRLVTDDTGYPVRPYARAFASEAENAEPLLEERWIQFTTGTLADISDPDIGWGGIEEWDTALRGNAYPAVCKTIAIALEMWVPGQAGPGGAPVPDSRRAGKMMLDAGLQSYSTAIGGAYMLANGATAEKVGEVLAAGIKTGAKLPGIVDEAVSALLAEEAERQAQIDALRDAVNATPTSPAAPSPSDNGSPSTSKPDTTSTDSGDSPPRKSRSSSTPAAAKSGAAPQAT